MKTIKTGKTLSYYDGVLVFEAQDSTGVPYIGSAVKPVDRRERFMVTAATPERLQELRDGKLDLRTLLLAAPGGEWHLAFSESGLDEILTLEPQAGNVADAGNLLPGSGFFLDPLLDEESAA